MPISTSMARHICRVRRLRRKRTSGRSECRTTTAKNVSVKARTTAEIAVARSPESDVRTFTCPSPTNILSTTININNPTAISRARQRARSGSYRERSNHGVAARYRRAAKPTLATFMIARVNVVMGAPTREKPPWATARTANKTAVATISPIRTVRPVGSTERNWASKGESWGTVAGQTGEVPASGLSQERALRLHRRFTALRSCRKRRSAIYLEACSAASSAGNLAGIRS